MSLPHVLDKVGFHGISRATRTHPEELVYTGRLDVILRVLLPEVPNKPDKSAPSSIAAQFGTMSFGLNVVGILIWTVQPI
jgi:hypothetical protein